MSGPTMLAPRPLPSIPMLRAGIITRRLSRIGTVGPGLRVVATGRTGSGKTTLGNRLLGVEYFLSHGGQDCTREVNLIRFPGGLVYSDLPGVCSDDMLENFNRAVLGLEQVPEFPTVTDLTVAEYTSNAPPARSTMPLSAFAGAHPAPDMLLYVLAADKQFTTDDRRYLRDLLTRHTRVVYALNIFGHSPPTEANVRDVVGKVAAIHRKATGAEAPVIAIDCRSGDGLAALLRAARGVLPAELGQMFGDIVADQERETPRAFARALRAELIDLGTAAAVHPAGAVGAEHSLHRATVGLWDAIATLRGDSATPLAVGAARFRPTIAATVGSATPTPDADSHAALLLALTREIRESVLGRLTRLRDGVRERVTTAFRAWQEEFDRRQALALAERAEVAAQVEALVEQQETLTKAEEELGRRVEAHRERVRQHQVQVATHEHQVRSHEERCDALSDQIDDFNDAMSQINSGAGADEHTQRQIDRERGRLERQQQSVNRQVRELNREGQRINDEVDGLRRDASALDAEVERARRAGEEFNARLAEFRKRRVGASRTAHSAWRLATADGWTRERCLSSYYTIDRELTAGLEELTARLGYTERRALAMRSKADDSDAVAAEANRIRANLLRAADQLSKLGAQFHGLWVRIILDRACNEVLTAHTEDHFDELGDGSHRGSTYSPLGADGAALLLAVAHLATCGWDLLRLPVLVNQYRRAIGAFPEPLTADGVSEHLRAAPDLFLPEFESAVTGLPVFSGEAADLD